MLRSPFLHQLAGCTLSKNRHFVAKIFKSKRLAQLFTTSASAFQADKPFSRGAPFLKDDIELLIDFFLANFRINPHNNDTLKVDKMLKESIFVQ
jgi:hypothetical protein